jgi:hypothetical protein
VSPGTTTFTATFYPDLPGAFGTGGSGLTGLTTGQSVLITTVFSGPPPTTSGTLDVQGAPVGTVQLSKGCNNVTPTVSERAAGYVNRVTGTLPVTSWQQQAEGLGFSGFSPLPGAPNNLTNVESLRPVWVCVGDATVLAQPPP